MMMKRKVGRFTLRALFITGIFLVVLYGTYITTIFQEIRPIAQDSLQHTFYMEPKRYVYMESTGENTTVSVSITAQSKWDFGLLFDEEDLPIVEERFSAELLNSELHYFHGEKDYEFDGNARLELVEGSSSSVWVRVEFDTPTNLSGIVRNPLGRLEVTIVQICLSTLWVFVIYKLGWEPVFGKKPKNEEA